ncbi:rhodanese-like domain-containing protein [Rhodococcus kronopolitis]|uniref:Rhodanese-like domain-containing protein n=1 Tax=Rhodococcus kronopolitis TaxID=1460226 RepID=A0ABV9FPW7_9NOCA
MLQVDLAALEQALADGAPVIDVREAGEYAQAHVPGVTLIPLSEFTIRYGEIPAAPVVYVICAMGGRSAQAAQFLGAAGINAANVDGGTDAWIASGRPVETGA